MQTVYPPSMSNRPWEKALDRLAVLGLLLNLGLAAAYYHQLPEVIPTHFGPSGQADGFGNKTFFWLLPGLSVVLYLLMTLIGQNPNNFNYPVKITPENKVYQHQLALLLLKYLRVAVLFLFTYLIWGIIQTALGHTQGLHGWMLPVLLLMLLGPIFWYWIKSTQKTTHS